MQRSFVALSPQEVLQVAISIENRNAELYHNFAEMFTEFGDKESLEIAAVFWEMAVEERGHSWQLKQKYTELYGDLVCSITEQELLEIVEVPKLETANVLDPLADGMPGRVRALKVALQAEVGAQQFYQKLAERTPAGPLRDIFSYLSQMEDSHVSYLETKLAQNPVGAKALINFILSVPEQAKVATAIEGFPAIDFKYVPASIINHFGAIAKDYSFFPSNQFSTDLVNQWKANVPAS